jgi:2-polyprenyl-3-methyl-5-hydroxy-6-metoxy-1,4-benzoquinol methylase
MSVEANEAKKFFWFNSVDFGDFQTVGREGPDCQFPNWSLYPTMDLISKLDVRGKRCIDIGSASGLIALGLHELGAEYVAAVDAVRSGAFEFGIKKTGKKIDYRTCDVSDVHKVSEWVNSFDLVISSGLMYHLISPFQIVYAAKRLLRGNGIFILQSLVTKDNGSAASYTNTHKQLINEPTTFIVPTPSAMRGFMDLGLFDRKLERSIKNPGEFYAIMGINRSHPSEVASATHITRKTFDFYLKNPTFPYGGYSWAEMTETKPVSVFAEEKVPAVQERELIVAEKYKLTFPFAAKARR